MTVQCHCDYTSMIFDICRWKIKTAKTDHWSFSMHTRMRKTNVAGSVVFRVQHQKKTRILWLITLPQGSALKLLKTYQLGRSWWCCMINHLKVFVQYRSKILGPKYVHKTCLRVKHACFCIFDTHMRYAQKANSLVFMSWPFVVTLLLVLMAVCGIL